MSGKPGGYNAADKHPWEGRKATYVRQGSGMPPPRFDPFSGQARAEHGCIVTAREQEGGECIVLHHTGSDALARVCATLDKLPGEWRVLSYSTPTTIVRDLQGTRQQASSDSMQYPEYFALAHIGRLELLDPSLAPRMTRGTTHG